MMKKEKKTSRSWYEYHPKAGEKKLKNSTYLHIYTYPLFNTYFSVERLPSPAGTSSSAPAALLAAIPASATVVAVSSVAVAVSSVAVAVSTKSSQMIYLEQIIASLLF
jgi:hypothetical protein